MNRRNFFAGAMAAGAISSGAEAHDWYSYECCEDRDCAQLPDGLVRAVQGGWQVTVEPGQHPMLKHRIDMLVSYYSHHIRRSKDEHFHLCIIGSGPAIRCLYVPEFGA